MNRKNSVTKDLTNGTPWILILNFALPLLLGAWFQQFYAMVDTMIVGRVLGAAPLAGVGSTGSINFLILGCCMGICSGFGIPIAQFFGAEDYDRMRKTVGNAVFLSAVMSVSLAVIVSLLCPTILRLMDTPEEIFGYAYHYILIIFMGIPVSFFYNMAATCLRSLGDSQRPFYFLLFSSGLNIVLDLLMVRPLGVRGPALATVISQFTSAMLCLYYIRKRVQLLRLSGSDYRPSGDIIRILLNNGIPMGLQYSITAIGSVILQTAVNGLGTIAVAAMTAGLRVSFFFSCVADSVGSAMATYCGQNIGAGKFDRIRTGVRSSVVIGVIYSVLAYLIVVFFGKNLINLFVDPSETEIIAYAKQILLTCAAFYFLVMLLCTLRFSIQGMGHGKFAMFAGAFEMVARTLVALLLIPQFGFTGACFANPSAWFMADVFLVPAYFKVLKNVSGSTAPSMK